MRFFAKSGDYERGSQKRCKDLKERIRNFVLERGIDRSAEMPQNSQPYDKRASIASWSRFGEASPEEPKNLVLSPEYLSLHQAGFIGNQYFCFRCLAVCPIGVKV
ncbi:MAG: hypothetical protein HXX11_19195 [Desulfuromonadales bacterium]|nr:hypothetical protein [Desulfuromonadales bacterium]